MDYVGNIYRPPSEAQSLLLQVTVGCSHNGCTYCQMYKGERFKPKPWEVVEADIEEARRIGPRFTRLFLCDGDSLILSQKKLEQILRRVQERLPWVERVGTYGDTRSVLRKRVEQLSRLRELGLGIVYHGVESGDAETLRRIDKGGTVEECVETAERLRAAGITHSVMVLLGIGGRARSAEHASATAALLTRMQPPFAGALTTTVVPGTPLAEEQARGDFTLPDKLGLLRELRTIVAESDLSATRFSANHASNYLPLRASLPRDKAAVLALLDDVLESGDESRLEPEYLRAL